MIGEIDAKLCQWGRWSIRHAKAGIGFPSVSPMFRDMPVSHVYRSSEPIGVLTEYDMDKLSVAVGKLPEIHKITCIVHYQHCKSWSDSCRKLGISRKALSTYLDQAHRKIMFILSENT